MARLDVIAWHVTVLQAHQQQQLDCLTTHDLGIAWTVDTAAAHEYLEQKKKSKKGPLFHLKKKAMKVTGLMESNIIKDGVVVLLEINEYQHAYYVKQQEWQRLMNQSRQSVSDLPKRT